MDRPPPPSSSDYADHVRGILERAAEVEAAQGAETAQGKSVGNPLVLGVLAIGLVAVIIYNIQFSTGPLVPLTAEEAERATGITLMVATQAIEAYRQEHGVLPGSLEELGFPEGSIAYTVSGSEYALGAATEESDTVRFSSEEGPMGILREMGLPTDPAEMLEGVNR